MDTEQENGTGRLLLAGASLALAGAAWMASSRAARRALGRTLPRGQHIVIVGGGFAGVAVASELARRLPPEVSARITLVSETNYLLFTPLLTEVAAGQLDPGQVVAPLRHLAPCIKLQKARVEGMDLGQRTVAICAEPVDSATPARRETLHADHLVLALGSSTSFHGIPGLEEHCFTMKRLRDAADISNRVLALLERASLEPDPDLRRALLTIVVGGGGFSGVETMAAVNDFIRGAARYYPQLGAQDLRTALIHEEGRLLGPFDEELARDAQRELERRGVEVRLDTKLTGAGDGWVDTDRHGRLAAHTLIWTGGVEADPLVKNLDVQHGHGGSVVVDGCCAVPGHPGVWALGDCAQVPRPDGEGAYAPLAQNATREGALVAENIVAVMSGGQPRPFTYRTIGQLALVGQRAGVASLWGFRFSGLIAWFMWRSVYLVKMPSLRRRIRIALDWTLDMAFGYDVVERPGSLRQPGLHARGGECR